MLHCLIFCLSLMILLTNLKRRQTQKELRSKLQAIYMHNLLKYRNYHEQRFTKKHLRRCLKFMFSRTLVVPGTDNNGHSIGPSNSPVSALAMLHLKYYCPMMTASSGKDNTRSLTLWWSEWLEFHQNFLWNWPLQATWKARAVDSLNLVVDWCTAWITCHLVSHIR